MPNTADLAIVRFGEFCFDPARGQISRHGVILKLPPQPFRLLQILLDQAPRIVTREEIATQIWGDEVHVDLEQSINFCVRQIRSALSDSASNPQFIDTLPKQGYRFIAEIIREEAGSPQANTTTETPAELTLSAESTSSAARDLGISRRNLISFGGAALLGGAAIWAGRRFTGKRREGAINVVLSLPEGATVGDSSQVNGAPAIAPDGTAVVVSLSTAQGSYLFIRRLDADRLIRMEGTQDATQPFWSPDSQHVAFFADSKLKRMPVAGGSAIVLCDASGPRGGTWGSGAVIIFGLNYRGLFQVSEVGGAVSVATKLNAGEGENSHRYPVFLPDGNRFLYFARTDDADKRAIWMDSLRSASGRQRIGIVDGYFALGRNPEEDSWYLLSQQGTNIVTQAFDVRRGILSGPLKVLVNQTGLISASGTGVLVILTDQQMLNRLVWLDRSGLEVGAVGEPNDYWNVALSPDDRSLLAVRHNFLTGQFEVLTASCARGLLQPLSRSNHAITAFWSSDSTAVYFTETRNASLVRLKASPGEPEETVMDLKGKPPVLVEDVSPDGQFVIGERITDGAHAEICWSESTQSPVWHSIGASGPVGLHARISPDGRWLAFASCETGRSEIYTMSFPDGSKRRRISNDGGHTPCWRRDGKELFYLANDGSMTSVALSSGSHLEADAPEKLFQVNLRLGSDRPLYGVSGDGQRFLVVHAESTPRKSEVHLILHWPSLVA